MITLQFLFFAHAADDTSLYVLSWKPFIIAQEC